MIYNIFSKGGVPSAPATNHQKTQPFPRDHMKIGLSEALQGLWGVASCNTHPAERGVKALGENASQSDQTEKHFS